MESMIFNFETIIFPIYGLMIGVNYWDSDMDENLDEDDILNEKQHCLQFMFLIAGISFVWYSKK